MIRLLELVYLIFLGLITISKVIRLLRMTKCERNGHKWERIELDTTYNNKTKVTEVIERFQCKICNKKETKRHYEY